MSLAYGLYFLDKLIFYYKFRIEGCLNSFWTILELLTILNRAAHRSGGRVPTPKMPNPSSGGWRKIPSDFRPEEVRAGGGRIRG